MVDIVLTDEQTALIRRADGPVRLITAGRETVCVLPTISAEPSDPLLEVSGECEPLSPERLEELVRRITDPAAEYITTEELIRRLDARRAS